MNKLFYPTNQNASIRLDKFLNQNLSISRSQIKKAIDEGRVLVNGQSVKAGYLVEVGDEISYADKEPISLKPIDLNLQIYYEDEVIAVLEKPRGLLVHPSAHRESKTLVHGLLYRFPNLCTGTEEFRPGIVHRLDRDTSGLMVIAKTNSARDHLIQQFSNNRVTKKYIALVEGIVTEEQTITMPIGRSHSDRSRMSVNVDPSKSAITHFKPIRYFSQSTLVDISIETGRTHQIRVHLSSIGHPIVGDPIYGHGKKGRDSQYLHSYYLEFNNPKTDNRQFFISKLPEYFRHFLKNLENTNPK